MKCILSELGGSCAVFGIGSLLSSDPFNTHSEHCVFQQLKSQKMNEWNTFSIILFVLFSVYSKMLWIYILSVTVGDVLCSIVELNMNKVNSINNQ